MLNVRACCACFYSSLLLSMLQAFQQLAKRFDKRALQHDIDTHRLFLLTEYHARLASGTESCHVSPFGNKIKLKCLVMGHTYT